MNRPDSNQNQPLVFIILVNWNGKDDTLTCLHSLGQITYGNYRILVVDNGSRDGSVESIRKHFPHVQLICNSRNERFARANNQAIRLALQKGADFILLLNNDTEVAPDFLAQLISRAQSDPRIGMVGPKIYYGDQPDLIWFAGGGVSFWRGRIWHYGLRQKDQGQFEQSREVGYITGCCLLASRPCIEATGLLDESYFIYGEDVDWCHRARKASFRTVYEPKAKVWHKISSSSGGTRVPGGLTSFKIFHKIRGMLKFFRRWGRWYHWLTIPVFMLFELGRVVIRMLMDKNWQGLLALMRIFIRTQRKQAPGG